ncbi:MULTISPECIES: hypothetical protein [unclassified Streptomyces]|uniref:hypothetical protein n=1 Tax=unclassified Streptomyces TaxID=2593676 RepID=UPI0004BE9EB7|nr:MULTISPECIES: hypothetical protein [unclassified Streptomyces]
MPDRDPRPRTPAAAEAVRRVRPRRPTEVTLFSGVYGLVMAGAMAAALDSPGEAPDPGSDALWVLLTAVASAAAHGYAHVVAHRASSGGRGARAGLRAMAAEWPVVAAAAPTVVLLLFAVPPLWREETAVDTALVLNALLLTGWGVWTAWSAGRGRGACLRAGAADLVIGLVIILANAVIK